MTDIRPLPKDVLNVVRLPSSRCTARQNKAGRLDRKADFLCFYVAFVLFFNSRGNHVRQDSRCKSCRVRIHKEEQRVIA